MSAATPTAPDQEVDRYAALRQYSLGEILVVWAAAAIPMGLLAWVVAPWLADQLGVMSHSLRRNGRGPVQTAAVIDSRPSAPPIPFSRYDGGMKIKGRNRHVAVDTDGLLLAVAVTTALQDRNVQHHRRTVRGTAFHDHPGVDRRRIHRPVGPQRAQDLGPDRGDRQVPRPGQRLRPAPPPVGRGRLLRLTKFG